MQASSPTIEIVQPKRFTAAAVMIISAYGVLLLLPLFFAILLVSLLKFGLLTILIPLLVVAVTVSLLPFGLGNTYATRLVKSLPAEESRGEEAFIVQLTLSPRIRSGIRAILDDADDLGCLRLASDALIFQGDSVRLVVPYDHIAEVQPRNIGLRGLFVYGRRIKVSVSNWPEIDEMEFAERSSCNLPASKRITRRLYELLSAQVSSATTHVAARAPESGHR